MLFNCGVGGDCQEIQPVHPKGNQSWVFTGRTDAETETSILWPPDQKCKLIGKDPNAGKDWRREKKGATEDEMVGWHHQLDGCEQTSWDSEGQGSLACCSPRGHEESDLATEQQNHHRSQFLKVNLLSHVYTLCWFYFFGKAKHTHPQWDVFRAHTVSTSCHRE